MRGDRPQGRHTVYQRMPFTPHARGSTVQTNSERRGTTVYPACAGIDLEQEDLKKMEAGLPRMRGDRP